jgi:FkbM family methyltransferase
MQFYSQYGQDQFIHANMPRGKFYVDIGAGDGIFLSNTYLFERLGWSGICVEPHDESFERLQKNRNGSLVNLCVWKESGVMVPFWSCGQPYLSGIPSCFKDHLSRAKGRLSGKKTISLKDLLIENNAPQKIDYLSLDTEGSELEILRGFDFSYVFRFITVEHNYSQRNEIKELLEEHGYIRVKTQSVDDWYAYRIPLLL